MTSTPTMASGLRYRMMRRNEKHSEKTSKSGLRESRGEASIRLKTGGFVEAVTSAVSAATRRRKQGLDELSYPLDSGVGARNRRRQLLATLVTDVACNLPLR